MNSDVGDNDFSDALYASVQKYLKGTVNGFKSGPCLSQAIDAALCTVKSAVADFTEVWNNDNSPVLALPNELLVECCEPLSFRGRVAASQVSRAWRETLLGNPALWTTIYIPCWLPNERAASRLRNMARRSGSAVLDVDWDIPNLSGIVAEVFGEAMPRIRSLSMPYSALDYILHHQAPALESLSIHGRFSTGQCVPSSWIVDCAPRLLSLSIDPFTLPTQFIPLCSIATFSGSLHAPEMSHPWSTRLFDIFPRLTSLTLYKICDATELPQFVLPTLRDIVLLSDQALDFSPIFDMWTAPPVDGKRHIRVLGRAPHALRAALRHLVAIAPPSTGANIALVFIGPSGIVLSTSAPYDLEIALTSVFQRWFDCSAALRGCPHVGMVVSLRLSHSMLIAVLRADVEFPAVETLTVTDNAHLASSAIHLALSRPSVPHLRVPRLQELVFDLISVRFTDAPPSTVTRLADFVRGHVRMSGGTLDSITIVDWLGPHWDDSDVAELFAFSRRVFHRRRPDSLPRAVEQHAYAARAEQGLPPAAI